MRGKISDQDLTNYALNDGMEPHERLYVESMLAVSEECRQDVYRNIELSQMLETGFERLYGAEVPTLTDEQREELMNPPRRRFGMATVSRAAAVLAMAACAAFALANPSLWQETNRRSLAQVSSHVSQLLDGTMNAGVDSGIGSLTLPTFTEGVESLRQTASDAMPQVTAICTPPTLDLDSSDLLDFR